MYGHNYTQRMFIDMVSIGYYKHNFVVTLGFAVVIVRNLNDWFLQTLTTRMRMQKWMLQVMVRVRSLY